MTVKTIYTCEKCGKETEKRSEHWEIKLYAKPYPCNTSPYDTPVIKQLCRECMEKLGLVATGNEELKKLLVAEPVTFEDIIRGMIAEEGRNTSL